MKRKFILSICLTAIYIYLPVSAQISYGGKPLFIDSNFSSQLRSVKTKSIIEMPCFDVDSALRLDALNEQNMRGSFTFAHKFYTKIRMGTDGENGVLEDGTKYWRVNIRSSKAYSINLLFTQFKIPEGGKLFIYNSDFSHIIGAFDHRNNSEDGIFPTRPIDGDEITIEYSEPKEVAFEAELEIGEVNHDYRGILRIEPGNSNSTTLGCMFDVNCEHADDPNVRATVLLIINGSSGCSGSLINNTANDGTPYLLTSVHCLNDSLGYSVSRNKDFYITRAGTIIAFFNYQRPICGSKIRATEEMTLARTYPRTIIENRDIALLQFQEEPPLHYNVYYAGWNVASNVANNRPFSNIHHPSRDVKRYGLCNTTINLTSFSVQESGYPKYSFAFSSHWRINGWTEGSTWGGSSGSPLFDNNGLIIGCLSGGNSSCNGVNPDGQADAFYVLYKGWTVNNDFAPIGSILDPNKSAVEQCTGFDPHTQYPLQRISNFKYTNENQLDTAKYALPNSGYLFGTNNLKTPEYAEEFNLEKESLLHGVYLFLPALKSNTISDVKIKVYSGENEPVTLLYEKTFLPQYLNYTNALQFHLANKSMTTTKTENFVPIEGLMVGKKFWIACAIGNSTTNFAVCNAKSNEISNNTAWIKNVQNNWSPAAAYLAQPVKTSLAIQALVTTNPKVAIEEITRPTNCIYQKSDGRLLLPMGNSGAGILYLYSFDGRLQQKISVLPQQSSLVIRPNSAGSIGIVRLIRGNQVYTNKFIY